MGYSVKILADSVNPRGVRLVTWELTYPRFVHSELMTHRVFSRSSASSRAIPAKKMREMIANDPVVPLRWLKNQSGMQGYEDVDPVSADLAQQRWMWLHQQALQISDDLDGLGVHKGIVNRVTEPWMWITVIVSSTEHMNWFALRDHPMAEIHLREFAAEMRDLYWRTTPTPVRVGEWHRPLVPDIDELRAHYCTDEINKIAIGRCARVSYLNHDGVRDPEKDMELFSKLHAGPHLAPMEHVAMSTSTIGRFGNFRGWKQYRQTMNGEAGPPEPLFDPETGEHVPGAVVL